MVFIHQRKLIILLFFVAFFFFAFFYFQQGRPKVIAQASSLTITNISDNRTDYANNEIPKYEKFEITFEIENTVASNVQMPYDTSPPPGLDPEIGISVDALFTPDNWQTVYQQPAFYYEEYDDQVKGNNEWFYPTGNFYWKVRFAPNQVGEWQFKLKAQDAGGTTETQPQSFTVVNSANKGFIKVSKNDERYFEFDDGTYFPGLGYNMNYNHVGWVNPILDNQENFQKMDENGIQLIRIWLSQWAIYGSAWNPWHAQDPYLHGALYIPHHGLTFGPVYPESELSMTVRKSTSQWDSACMFIGAFQASPAVKRNTDYRIRVRYKTGMIVGPAYPAFPNYGFVIKTGDWLWGDREEDRCYYPGTGTVISNYQSQETAGWEMMEARLNTSNRDFLPRFYLVMENAGSGTAYIDQVWIEEDLGGGDFGPNIVSKPDMDHHLYFEQRNSYSFDKVLDLAKQYDVYIRPVVLEKNDYIPNHIDDNGDYIATCDKNRCFYGNWRNMTKVRWLQQAWWRYLQARWGYSTNIHSWELLNEGDPWYGYHYALADELGKYMHCDVFGIDGGGWGDDCTYDHPNDHMVSTSNWHSFPKWDFWANPDYVDVDFADLHAYAGTAEDTAENSRYYSELYGAKQPGGAGKPLIRGETGFSDGVVQDTAGTWLHNYIWGGINPGGMIESYWYENYHIYTASFDHRGHYKKYYDFVKDIPLNNGDYVDAQAVSSNANLRAWGQKDIINGGLHLWIQNINHTWKKVVEGVVIAPESGTVTVSGFTPSQEYGVEWWDTYQGEISNVKSQMSNENGELIFQINNLTNDLAIRILPEIILPGDIDRDDDVDFQDFLLTLLQWLTSGTPPTFYEDINHDGKVNIMDLGVVVVNYGRVR